MAEGLLRHALKGNTGPLGDLKILSAGIVAPIGAPPSANAVRAMNAVGVDISAHRSRYLTTALLENALAVFVMTRAHAAALPHLAADAPQPPVRLMRDFLPDGTNKEIPDPFGGALGEYTACRDDMVDAVPGILAFLQTLLSK
jgi:protein-tyrosine phosphatase